jgi:UDP-2-acetamido-2,6-beta-L-arabino-hexul-4-ose reductase
MQVLITGSEGFIGSNLVARFRERDDVEVIEFDIQNTEQELRDGLGIADFVFHLAGVNRPESLEEFETGNVDLTERTCQILLDSGRAVPILLASSIQAERDNAYGRSKLRAEKVVCDYAQRSGAGSIIYRMKNVFGKWSRPNYNSVVATFCYNIGRDLPITVSDPDHEVEFIYIDDVIDSYEGELALNESECVIYREVEPSYTVTLGELAERIRSFRSMRDTLRIPNFDDPFTQKLYGTYLSYLAPDDFSYDLDQKCDPRGCLAEFIKSESAGQLFVSRTEPGITRGNHYHHTKTEKFLVLAGKAVVRFRDIRNRKVLEYHVRGEDFRVVDIPPGYTHSIENIGDTQLVTLFWASEIFDQDHPDTEYLPVYP